jgi:hypothetical protein
MEKEIATGAPTPETVYQIVFKDGKLVATGVFDSALLDAEVVLKLDGLAVVDALIDAIEKAIPGDQVAMAAMIKAAAKTALVK